MAAVDLQRHSPTWQNALINAFASRGTVHLFIRGLELPKVRSAVTFVVENL